jgi:glutathione S-transferase
MPKLELVSHALCPYVQRAAIALLEKQAPFTRTTIDLAQKPDWFRAVSPLGKVPLLLVDGEVLFESAAICDYLDETIPPRLHPADPVRRAQHRAWIEFASALLNDVAGLYSAADAQGFEQKLAVIAAKFGRLEQQLGRHEGPYFAGGDFSLADAAFAPVFRYFDVFERFVDIGIPADLPNLRAWRDALARRPSVQQAVTADYPALLEAFLRGRQSHLSRRMPATA